MQSPAMVGKLGGKAMGCTPQLHLMPPPFITASREQAERVVLCACGKDQADRAVSYKLPSKQHFLHSAFRPKGRQKSGGWCLFTPHPFHLLRSLLDLAATFFILFV